MSNIWMPNNNWTTTDVNQVPLTPGQQQHLINMSVIEGLMHISMQVFQLKEVVDAIKEHMNKPKKFIYLQEKDWSK